MVKKNGLTLLLTIIGTILVWFPVLAPVFLALGAIIQQRMARLDYLIPAELFPSALLGGGLLLWSASRAQARRGLIGWSFASAVGLLVGGQILAVASGDTAPVGPGWFLVLASFAFYVLALVVLGIGAILLLRDQIQPGQPTNGPGAPLTR